LPWNPMRLEQRIGRVDRIGQRRRVHAFHLIAGGTGETRVLERLQTRIARARMDLAVDGAVGSDEERAGAQLAILGTAGGGESTAGTKAVDSTIEWPNVIAEAKREAARLARARAIGTRGRDPSRPEWRPAGPLILRTRRSGLRASLGRRALLIW